jgi:hypothetical protein
MLKLSSKRSIMWGFCSTMDLLDILALETAGENLYISMIRKYFRESSSALRGGI